MLEEICEQFCFEGNFIYAEPYGCGHINDTYAVYYNRIEKSLIRYILQKINTDIFDPDDLMSNISLVTEYLKKIIIENHGDPLRETLTIIPTHEHESYFRDTNGDCWRSYIFIENTLTYQGAESEDIFYASGKAFGAFQNKLADFPTDKLHETIKDFHNTPDRYQKLLDAISENPLDRLRTVRNEIDFFMAHAAEYSQITTLIANGSIPLRVTHNDTKLNNILLDPVTKEGVCIIDLDTIMPGSLLYDFGDSIRFGANTAAEDEQDLAAVHLSIPLFTAYTKGFLSQTKQTLTDAEIDNLAFGAKLMTMECGMRFLTDYILGDHYFKIHRPKHNLDRARTQIKLVIEIESNMDCLNEIVREFAK